MEVLEAGRIVQKDLRPHAEIWFANNHPHTASHTYNIKFRSEYREGRSVQKGRVLCLLYGCKMEISFHEVHALTKSNVVSQTYYIHSPPSL